MKIKIISLILILAMSLMTIPSFAVFAVKEEMVSFEADSVSVSRGDIIKYTVSAFALNSVRGIQGGIGYDSSKVRPVKYEFCNSVNDEAYVADFKCNSGIIGFALSFETDFDINGEFATIEFEVLDNAASGKAGFSLSENGVVMICADGEEYSVNTTFEDVTINYDYNACITATTNSTDVYNDSDIVYSLSLSDLASMRGFSVSLGYVSDVFELVSATGSGFLDEGVFVESRIDTSVDGRIDIASEYAENTDLKGEFLTVIFKVKKDKPAKQYTPLYLISYEIVDNECNVADLDLKFESDFVELKRASYIHISYDADKDELGKGEKFVYTVTLDEITESRGFQGKLLYDTSQLKLVGVEKGELLNNASIVSAINTSVVGEISFLCIYEEEVDETGVIAILEFEVESGAKNGYVNMEAMDTFAVDSSYNYIDSENVNEIDYVYIGRKPRAYTLKLSADKESYYTGETVHLSAQINDAEKFLGVQFKIIYDPTKFRYVKPDKKSSYYGEMMKYATAKGLNDTNADKGEIEILLSWGESNPYNGVGDICTIDFIAISPLSGYAQFEVGNLKPSTDDQYSIIAEKSYIISDLTNVQKVIGLIDIIGEVTLESGKAIHDARYAYDALTDDEKLQVLNYVILETAEELYADISMIYVYKYECTDDNLITVTVKNNRSSDNPVLITAQYDDNNKMISVETEKLTLAVGETMNFDYHKYSETVKIKCMLWQDFVSIKPYKN